MIALIVFAVMMGLAGLAVMAAPIRAVRPAGRRATRRAERSASGDGPTQDQLTRRRVLGAWHDAFRSVFIWAPLPLRLASTRRRAVESRLHKVVALDGRFVAVLRRLEARAEALANRSHLSPLVARVLKIVIVLADVMLVGGAIRSLDDEENFVSSSLTSLTIALAMALSGQLIGFLVRERLHEVAKDLGEARARLRAAASVSALLALAMVAVGLGLLRGGQPVIGWSLLSLAPAVASAIVVILGPNDDQRSVWRLSREHRVLDRRLRRAMWRLQRVAGMFDRSLAVLRTGLVRDGELRSGMEATLLSEGAMVGDPSEVGLEFTIDDTLPGADALSEEVTVTLARLRARCAAVSDDEAVATEDDVEAGPAGSPAPTGHFADCANTSVTTSDGVRAQAAANVPPAGSAVDDYLTWLAPEPADPRSSNGASVVAP